MVLQLYHIQPQTGGRYVRVDVEWHQVEQYHQGPRDVAMRRDGGFTVFSNMQVGGMKYFPTFLVNVPSALPRNLKHLAIVSLNDIFNTMT